MRLSARWPILSLLLLFLTICTIYNANVPLGEGPDEHGHLAYVLFLAREWRLPVQYDDAAKSDVPGEGHQPPLAYLLAAPAVSWLPANDRQIVLTANRTFVWSGGDQPAAFMRGSREYWPWRSSTLVWHLARAISALCGAAAVLCTYLAARTLWPSQRSAPLLATAIVAFNPQFLFSCALVSNDPLLAALSTAILWRCMALANHHTPATSIGKGLSLSVCGILFGLALLTKQSAMLLGPLLLWGTWQAAQGNRLRLVRYTLAWTVSAGLVAGWWYLRNWQLYGDPFGATLFSAEFTSQPFVWGDIAAWSGALGQLFSSFWARFGWMSVTPPAWVLWIYGGLVAASAVGWMMRGRWMAGGRRSEISTRNLWAGPAILLVMAVVWIMSFAATAGLVAWQGRMLFPGIGAIGIVLAGGLVKVEGKRQGVLSFAMYLCLAVYMPFGVIAPAYTWVTLAPAQALEGLGTSVYIRYANDWEQGVVLRGWRLDGPVTPHVELPITLTWNSLEPIPRSWTVFIELRNASDQVVTRSESRPRDATLPFTYWTSGDWVADQHRITLPRGLDPGPYRLIVGLYRPEKNNMHLPVWAEDGSAIGDQAEVGEVLVLP